jgi:gluconate 2-dehydrogenase
MGTKIAVTRRLPQPVLEQLAAARSRGIVVTNTPGVMDDAALAAALKSRTIAAAAVDCFENEPTANPTLLECPNVLLTPHLGSATPDTRVNMVRLAIRNLAVGLQGGTPPNVVTG